MHDGVFWKSKRDRISVVSVTEVRNTVAKRQNRVITAPIDRFLCSPNRRGNCGWIFRNQPHHKQYAVSHDHIQNVTQIPCIGRGIVPYSSSANGVAVKLNPEFATFVFSEKTKYD